MHSIYSWWLLLLSLFSCVGVGFAGEIMCGAVAVDVSPRHLPVIRNGGFLQAEDHKILDPLHARCIVLAEGQNKIAIAVVDSCMMSLEVCDEAKELAAKTTGIASDHIMISATHTHTAPSVFACLGSGVDQPYREFLPGKIAEAIKLANDRLQPAKVGWANIDASNYTRCRRWITRTDKFQVDPFGERSVHANMHPGHLNSEFVGPSGPIDPSLSVLMVASLDDRPIAALANFSMHYYSGHSGVSADYYGRFANRLAHKLTGKNSEFVAIMSQGTSGDLWWGDYSRDKNSKPFQHIDEFADGMVGLAVKAISEIKYESDVPVRIAESRVSIKRRVPDEKRLAWAKRLNRLRGDRLPKDRPEVYALQAVYMAENPTDDLVLQAIRIGDLGITGIPNEVYALTGLKLKRRSPLGMTFNMSLANGACGYIPPPEQHALGGYTTWPATTAGLERSAEPKIVESLLSLLEQVAEEPRREYRATETEFSKRVMSTNPFAYWRLDEMERTLAHDASGNGRSLRYSGLVAFHLPGRFDGGFGNGNLHDSHAVQLAGGKLVADGLELDESYSVQFSFYVGTPFDFRETTATLLSRGADKLTVTGTSAASPGVLAFGEHQGHTVLEGRHWHQIVFIRNGDFVEVYLDGNVKPELSLKTPRSKLPRSLILGGDAENTTNLEGKLDEVCVYNRAISAEEIASLFRVAKAEQPSGRKTISADSKPLDVQASMNRIHVRDGFRVELVAAEPWVLDPVAIDWGADGKLWVAEMADYPMGMDGKGQPGGRIRYLEDTTGDGKYDTSTVFMEDVGFPNGVMAWRDGVLVTAAPEIFYAEDTTGDGKADRKETLLSGFMTGNQQLRVNGLRWGLDNRVHCASGAHHSGFGAGNSIVSLKANASVKVGSRDFRFDPQSGDLDPQSGPSQYGRIRNDFGDWFGVQNSQPLWHYVLADQYMRRNEAVASIDPRQQVRVPRMPQVFSAKPPQRRFHGFDHAGHYTSACGISMYRDDLLFPRGEQHAFTCEPFHNLVQHHLLTEQGVSFRGERADDGPTDFFASSDRWTRPVMTRTGPDGALWIVDMYRYMIEHPQWLPKEGQDALRSGYRAGETMGRIYRVVAENENARPWPQIENATTDEVVKSLAHRNGIVRDLAHRAILCRKNAGQADAIRTIAQNAPLPESRIQALSVLHGLDKLAPADIQLAAADSDFRVRRFAIQLAEQMPWSVVREPMLALVGDSHAKVRLQLAQSLGSWAGEEPGRALSDLAQQDSHDPFHQAAVVSSLPTHFEAFVEDLGPRIPTLPEAILDATLLMCESHPNQLPELVHLLLADDVTGVSNGSRGLSRWLDSLAKQNKTLELLSKQDTSLTLAAEVYARKTAGIRAALVATQEIAVEEIGLLGREPAHYRKDVDLLARSLSNEFAADVQSAAVARLARIPAVEAPEVLVDRSSGLLPSVREQVVAALMSREDGQLKLLEAFRGGSFSASDLSLAQRNRVLNSKNAKIAKCAADVLGAVTNSSRSQIVAEYAQEVGAGDASRGQRVFEQECKVCHSLDRQQNLVGPDLRSLTERSASMYLHAILDPSQTVEPKYTNFTFVMKNGQSLVGIVAEEGAGSMTVRDAEGKSHTVLRNSIEFVQRLDKSIMPEGFETKISSQQMADLVAFLQAI